jgi:transcription initiation factor TFIIF subunit beta
MATVKPDPGTKLEPKSENQDIDMTSIPSIKPESDDELYEDAGDLDMVEGSKAVWLVKLPSFVAERWNDIDEDEEIVLGVVKVNPNNNEQVRLKSTLEVVGLAR